MARVATVCGHEMRGRGRPPKLCPQCRGKTGIISRVIPPEEEMQSVNGHRYFSEVELKAALSRPVGSAEPQRMGNVGLNPQREALREQVDKAARARADRVGRIERGQL